LIELPYVTVILTKTLLLNFNKIIVSLLSNLSSIQTFIDDLFVLNKVNYCMFDYHHKNKFYKKSIKKPNF
jgi:hypothetical protein